MEQGTMKRTKRLDRLISVALAILIFFVGLYGTTDYPAWGDDYAAYYNEAIAIAEGTSAEQHARNYLYHPSPMPTEAEDGVLCYVWGYPLLLSFVYRIVGFDRVNYDMFVYYKLVSVIAFALCAALIYLFFRRRFSTLASLLFAVFVGVDGTILYHLGTQYSDIVFFFFTTASMLLAECFLSSDHNLQRLLYGLLLGISMWYAHEVRLNGIMFIGMIAVLFFLHLLRKRRSLCFNQILLYLFPFILCFALMYVFDHFIFWKATSNASDFSSVTLASFLDNANYYYFTMRDWIATSLSFGLVQYPIPRIIKLFAMAFLALCALGIIETVRKKDLTELCYAGLLAFFFIGASMLPYQQAGRYSIPFMPFALLFLGRGVEAICRIAKKLFAKKWEFSAALKRACHVTAQGAMLLYLCCLLFFANKAIQRQDFMWLTRYDGPYMPSSIEMYQYVQEHVEEDALIITEKPRALYLNTQRESIPFENGHTVDEADYFLQNIVSSMPDHVQNGMISVERMAEMDEVYRTDNFVLYRTNKQPEV